MYRFFKNEDYSQVKFYISELKRLDEKDCLFKRYLGKIYYASINTKMINDKQFNKICKKMNRLQLKLSHNMQIVIRMYICKMTIERIPVLEEPFKIGHIFSEKTLELCDDEELKKELSVDPFYASKNILIANGKSIYIRMC